MSRIFGVSCLLILLLLNLSSVASAKEPQSSLDKKTAADEVQLSREKRADIEELVRMTMPDEYFSQFMDMSAQQFMSFVSVGMNNYEEQLTMLAMETAKEVMLENLPSLKESIIDLYDQKFSHEEIKQILLYQRSPVGQKALRLMPELMRRSSEMAMAWVASLEPQIKERLRLKGIDPPF